jgi:hypothetical protein
VVVGRRGRSCDCLRRRSGRARLLREPPGFSHADDRSGCTALRRRDGGLRRGPGSTTETAPGSPSAAGSRFWTATATANRTSTSPAVATRRRSIATTARSVAPSSSLGSPRFGHRPDRTWSGPTRSTSTATATSTWPCCVSAGPAPARARQLPLRSRPMRPGRSPTTTPGPRPSAPPGKGRPRCRRWPSATTSSSTRRARRPSTAPTARSTGRRRIRRATAPIDLLSRPATARCRCSSAIGTARAGATCG